MQGMPGCSGNEVAAASSEQTKSVRAVAEEFADRGTRRILLGGLGAAISLGSAVAHAEMTVPVIPIEGSAKPMPAIGFGTCCRKDVTGPPIVQAAKAYLANGGRLIDTAQLYENHKDLAVAIKESGVPRSDLWVTSKVLVCGSPKYCAQSSEQVVRAVDKSKRELGLEYIDLMLLHGAEGWGVGPQQDVDLWKGLIEAKRSGLVTNIGVSNHNRAEIERLVAATGVKPAVNQIEFHPWVPSETMELARWCKGQGIAVTAYGSLGGAGNKAQGDSVDKIARKHGVSKAQVLLRWALNKGVAVIPGSNNEKHIKENLMLTDIVLDENDAAALENAEKPDFFRRWHSCKSGCAS